VRSGGEVDITLDWEVIDCVVLNKRIAQDKQPLVTADRTANAPCTCPSNTRRTSKSAFAAPSKPEGARTETVSKIHLFPDLPQPFTDEACRHSAGVVRVPPAGRHARPRPDEDDRRHPEPVAP